MTGVPDDETATVAIRALEPIFHRGLAGSPAAEVARAVHPDYREVGASGTVYERESVIDTVAARAPVAEDLPVDEFAVARLDASTWLATYVLYQGERRTRRATIWQWRDGAWVIRYHQGTLA